MIVSFYSYKGGVGRTQLCANIAAYLCHRKGKKVLLWDWDFEAPGLHYYFGKTNADIKTEGTIEMLDRYANMMRRATTPISEADYSFLPEEAIISLIQGKKTRINEAGKIDLIVGGNYSKDYVFKVNNFAWYEFYELLDGKVYMESVKAWAKGLGYDYVLIDSRTGINDYSGICNLQLPDANVVIMAANEQNIAGCKRIIDQILQAPYTQQGYRKPYIFPVLSRINANQGDIYEMWSNRFVEEFYEILKKLDPEVNELFIEDIFRHTYLEKTILQDEPQLSGGENLLITEERTSFNSSSALIARYTNIGEYLEGIAEENSINIESQIEKQEWLKYGEQAIFEKKDSKAALAFEKAREWDKSIEYGGTPKVYLEKGNEARIKGNFDKAIQYYEQAKNLDTQHAPIYFYLGLAFQAKRDLDTAIKYYKRAIELNPEYTIAYINLGIILKANGDLDAAIVYYKKAIKLNPKDAKIYNNLGIALKAKRDLDGAIIFYEKAIELNSKDSTTHYNLGNAFLEKGDLDGAIVHYERAIELNPDKSTTHNNLGNAFLEKGDLDGAIVHYERAIKLNPKNSITYNNLGVVFFKKRDLDVAIVYYKRAIELNPKDINAYNDLGDVFFEKGDLDGAIVHYKRVIKLNPKDVDAYNKLGTVFWGKGNLGMAIKYYKRAIELNPKSANVHYNLGDVFFEKGDLDGAIVHYEKSIKLNPKDFNSNYNLGVVFFKKGNLDMAIKYYKRAIELNPKSANMSQATGWNYLLLDKLGFAKNSNLLQAWKLSEAKIAAAPMNLGQIYLLQGDTTKALEWYKISIPLWEDKIIFFKGMEQDYIDLKMEERGVAKEVYEDILKDLKSIRMDA